MKKDNSIKNSLHPRAWLSYSAMKMWELNPEEFKLKYFRPDQYIQRTNRGQSLGKEVADALEIDVETGNLEIDIILAQITPKLPRRDEKIFTKLSIGKYPHRGFV